MSALEKVISWANTDIPAWQTDAVRRLLTSDDLTENDKDELYLMMKVESGLIEKAEDTPSPKLPTIDGISSSAKPGDSVCLKSIQCIENVNAIPNLTELPIGHVGVTVIYGENGSGKSGFSRVLKRACNARDKKDEVLGDIFGANFSKKPRVKFKLDINDNRDTFHDWHEGIQDSIVLSKSAVFDSKCARIIIDNRNEYHYTAYGTNVFEELVKLSTCGSGAFLFAALNILEPLYETCIERMQEFVSASTKGKYKFFEEILNQVNALEHPNRQYFIYKSIILNNLHGVDIMNEAVEIAKLRLFLKLMTTVEADYRKPNIGLEPLPDVDFNIRAGNTLIGYANEKQLMDSLTYDTQGYARPDAEANLSIYNEKCDVVARAFKRYKEIQLSGGDDYREFKKAKAELIERLKKLTGDFDGECFTGQYDGKTSDEKGFLAWLASHRPFHWFAEYYEIISRKKGFDVIIGNPPYVELKKIRYKLFHFRTNGCGNLYPLIVERNSHVMSNNGRSGMIIPHSSICTDRMSPLIEHLKQYGLWFSSYDIRPSKLFDGVDQRLLIYLTNYHNNTVCTSRYHRWTSEYRSNLFVNIEYIDGIQSEVPNSIIKAAKDIEKSIHSKIALHTQLATQSSSTGTPIYYHNAPRYFIRVVPKPPYFWNEKDGEKVSTQVKALRFGTREKSYSIATVLNSNLFYWWFVIFSDSRHLNSREIDYFKFTFSDLESSHLLKVYTKLIDDYESNKYRKETCYKATGKVVYDEYYPKLSKQIIDEIDVHIALNYNFTHSELDFIINYDIKYRMGKELEGSIES